MLTVELQAALSAAVLEAQQRQHEYVTLEHVLYALTHDERGMQVLRSVGADLTSLRRELESYLDSDQWRGKAGAYGIQDEAQAFLQLDAGAFDGVVGLHVDAVRALLARARAGGVA